MIFLTTQHDFASIDAEEDTYKKLYFVLTELINDEARS